MSAASHAGRRSGLAHCSLGELGRAGCLALVYFWSARLSLTFVVQPEGLAAVWLPSGLMLAALLLNPQRTWPLLLWTVGLTNTLANWLSGTPFPVSLGFAIANCAESGLAAWLLVRYLGTPLRLTTLRGVWGLVGIAAIASNACTALLGAAVPSLGFGAPFWSAWRVWWIADGVGMLLVAPVVLTWAAMMPWTGKTCSPLRVVEAGGSFIFLLVLAQVLFGSSSADKSSLMPLPYLTFPCVLWIAVRFGPPGATAAALALAGVITWHTIHGHGPFVAARLTVTGQLLEMQAFLSAVSLTALVVAVMLSERQCAEATVRESEARFRTIAEAMPLPVVINRLADGLILYANAHYGPMFGLPSDAVIGRKTTDFFYDPADRQQFLEALHQQGALYNYEILRKKADGTPSWVIGSFQTMVFNGEPAVVGGFYDISERKHMEEELQRSEALLKGLINNTPAIIHIKSAAGRYLLVNTQFEKVYSTTNAQLIGKTAYDVLPRDLAERLHGLDMQVLESRRAVQTEAYAQRTDGLHTYVTIKFPLLDAGGVPYAICGISTDITERKQAEEALQCTAAELARSNADLEQFAYAASHDLQEPLRAVAGCLQVLQQRYTGQLDARAAEFISHAVDGAMRMQTLIHDLLAYSRVSTRGQVFTPVSSTTALDQALANLRLAIAESGAVVTHDSLPTVQADATQLLQVFQNLLGNAIKFRSAQPPAIHVGAEYKDGAWVFAVRDNGIGIAPRHAERIFSIFQRLHTRKQYPGTGIGLALCKKIVERHGGSIWMESQPGQGATFFFSIPMLPLPLGEGGG